MATRIQVRKLANPRKRRKVTVKRRNATKRRRMSPKQIRHFGTKAQKAGLKRRRNRKYSAYTSEESLQKELKRKRSKRRNKRRPNPAPVILTVGALNPRRKRRNKPVAATRKNRRRRRVNSTPRRMNKRRRRNPAAKRANRRRRRNATRIVVVSPKANRRRRRNSYRRNARRVNHRRRRNPINTELFGAPLFGKNSLELVGGGLLGVVAAKFIPTLLPASMAGGITSSNIGKTVITGIAAVVGGWAGSKVSPQFGQGMLFGGMMQTLSVALNAFLPSVYSQLNPSLGDLMNGSFTVPQNPLRLPPPPPPPAALPPAGAQARMNMNGLARAYGSAF